MSSMTGFYGTTGTSTGSSLVAGAKNKIPKGHRLGQLQQFTPEQVELFQRSFGQVGPDSYLSRLASGDEEMFRQIEEPALRQFAGLQGNIASRFSGQGIGGRHSSGFQNTMTSAAQDFASQLQSQRMGLQRQAIQDLFGMSQSLLSQRPVEQFLVKKDMPFWKQLLLGGAEKGAEMAPMFAKAAMMGAF